MITWRRGTVFEVGRTWDGAVELGVHLDSPLSDSQGTQSVRALAFPALVGAPAVGSVVLLNVNALARGLGTGGYAMVVALPDELPADPPAGPGHLVKARYTPLQAMVLGVDEQESAHHEALLAADSLVDMPVVAAALHSSLPAIIAGVRLLRPQARIVYVMTDGGALPAWFSRTVSELRHRNWLAATVSVGQAFGGDFEAVSLHSGLLAARHVLGADLAVVAQGPGNLGTGTPWGFSAVSVGEAVNAISVLSGRAVAALRISGADPRPRHRGLSHHSITALGRVALRGADLVVPNLATIDTDAVPGIDADSRAELAALQGEISDGVAQLLKLAPYHREVAVPVGGLLPALAAAPVRLTTMGRGLAEDPAAFLAAAAAGRHAAQLLG